MSDKAIIAVLAILLLVNAISVFALLADRRKRIIKSNQILERLLNR